MRPSGAGLTAVALAAVLALAAHGPAGARAGGGCPGAGTPSVQLTKGQVRAAVRCLVNRERARRRHLRLHRKLNRPAAKHSRRMREHSCLQHACPGEPPTLAQRLRKYLRGARRSRIGEVIAVNLASATPREVVRQWMTSEAHRPLVVGRFKHMGVGIAIGRGYAWYTVELGWKR